MKLFVTVKRKLLTKVVEDVCEKKIILCNLSPELHKIFATISLSFRVLISVQERVVVPTRRVVYLSFLFTSNFVIVFVDRVSSVRLYVKH